MECHVPCANWTWRDIAVQYSTVHCGTDDQRRRWVLLRPGGAVVARGGQVVHTAGKRWCARRGKRWCGRRASGGADGGQAVVRITGKRWCGQWASGAHGGQAVVRTAGKRWWRRGRSSKRGASSSGRTARAFRSFGARRVGERSVVWWCAVLRQRERSVPRFSLPSLPRKRAHVPMDQGTVHHGVAAAQEQERGGGSFEGPGALGRNSQVAN